jgi:hypothetical protein
MNATITIRADVIWSVLFARTPANYCDAARISPPLAAILTSKWSAM